MNAILLTVLALNGAGGGGVTARSLDGPGVDAATGAPCEACAGGRQRDGLAHCLQDWCGPMPQSCYNPAFGCYPGTRHMHRYPAFHNTYYRSAYNYRQYFDYPWHAGLHEPTSLFSHHVPAENNVQSIPAPPQPSAKLAPPPRLTPVKHSPPIRSSMAW